MWNKKLFRSFSLRAGLIIFLAFCGVLLSLRMVIYYQAIRTVEEDTKNIILAHSVGIKESLEKHDTVYMNIYIEEILKDIHDPHLVIALHDKRLTAGNIAVWPYRKNPPKGWVDLTLPKSKFRTKPMLILANVTRYPDGRTLLVGYDLYRLQLFQDTLGLTLVENVAISFAMAFSYRYCSFICSTGTCVI